jgi:hypothetical protein
MVSMWSKFAVETVYSGMPLDEEREKEIFNLAT